MNLQSLTTLTTHIILPMKNNQTACKTYYTQMLIGQKQIENDILNGYYTNSCVPEILNLIKEETSKYTKKLQG